MFWRMISLDFKTFAIAQPNASTSQCDSGYFQVGGVVNDVPLLCGDNDGQHSKIFFFLILKFYSWMTIVAGRFDILICIDPFDSVFRGTFVKI